MAPEGDGRFFHRIASALNSFQYQAVAGRYRSPLYHVRVVEPPEIGKISLTLFPPRYTGLGGESKEGGHIEGLKGTVVNLEAQATKAIKEGRVILNHRDQILLKVEGNRLEGTEGGFVPHYAGLLR